MIQIIGFMDSPFVRRVAVSAQFLGVPYENTELSIFRDVEQFRKISPLVKVPTLVIENGQILVDSMLIIDYLESLAGRSLMPDDENEMFSARQVIGTALVAGEKVAQIIYETKLRPEAAQHEPWTTRIEQQLTAATKLLEAAVGDGSSWICGSQICQADITTAIVWRFIQKKVPNRIQADDYPGLVKFSGRAESLAEFIACPLS